MRLIDVENFQIPLLMIPYKDMLRSALKLQKVVYDPDVVIEQVTKYATDNPSMTLQDSLKVLQKIIKSGGV